MLKENRYLSNEINSQKEAENGERKSIDWRQRARLYPWQAFSTHQMAGCSLVLVVGGSISGPFTNYSQSAEASPQLQFLPALPASCSTITWQAMGPIGGGTRISSPAVKQCCGQAVGRGGCNGRMEPTARRGATWLPAVAKSIRP